MTTLFYIILIIAVALALVFIISRMKSGGSPIEDTAPQWPAYDRISFREAMDRTWKLFENPYTLDIAELASGKLMCQISIDNSGDEPAILVTYAIPDNNPERYLPGAMIDKADVEGNLFHILYPLPEDKLLLEAEIREVYYITETDTINFCIWKA